jgi:hypothetical protein
MVISAVRKEAPQSAERVCSSRRGRDVGHPLTLQPGTTPHIQD